MAISQERHKAHRKKGLEKAKTSIELDLPLVAETKVRDKIRVPVKSPRSALVKGEGKSMGMEID